MTADSRPAQMARVARAEAIVPAAVLEGVTRHVMHGDGLTVMRIGMDAGAVILVHTHVHEQYTHVVSGRIDMVLHPDVHGLEEVVRLSDGDGIVIPSMVPHEARAVAATESLEMFAPRREDLPEDL
jgi:mannose-6-phosphate isomerase-like protein (cupin superfamily)